MLRFREALLFIFLFVLIFFLVALPQTSDAALGYTASRYNINSLCYISTDVVEVSLARHQAANRFAEDTFTATVLETLGGDYKVGDTIELPYPQVPLPLYPCSLCILFIARKQFQPNFQDGKAIPPQVNEVMPVDVLNHVHRYSQWWSLLSVAGSKPEDDPDEQRYPQLKDECRTIKSRWAAVNQVRPLLSLPFRQQDVPAVQKLRLQRQPFLTANPNSDDLIEEVIHAQLADLRDPASHHLNALIDRINLISAFQHIIAVH